VDPAPWLRPSGGDSGPAAGESGGFEDWYLVSDWAAVGDLNRQAVLGEADRAHRAVAGRAGAGAGGLYELRGGQVASAAQPCATWLNKPANLSYSDFDGALAEALASPGTGLWQRQLVLGPASEFCLLSPAPLPPPVPVDQVVSRRRLR
jgi:hypothetical protein